MRPFVLINGHRVASGNSSGELRRRIRMIIRYLAVERGRIVTDEHLRLWRRCGRGVMNFVCACIFEGSESRSAYGTLYRVPRREFQTDNNRGLHGAGVHQY